MGGIFSRIDSIHTRREHKEERSRHFLTFLESIRNWHLILILIPLLFLAATFLRLDHLEMTHLRDAVLAADDANDDEAIANALYELRTFTSHHIIVNFIEHNGNFDLVFGTGPFYLDQQYLRKATEALAEAQRRAEQEISDANPNGNVFAYANAVCQPQAIANHWAWNSSAYLNCYVGIINSFPTTDYITTTIIADIPSTALFRYDYASPAWCPSLSGWTIVICAILLLVIAIRAIYWIGLQIAFRIVK